MPKPKSKAVKDPKAQHKLIQKNRDKVEKKIPSTGWDHMLCSRTAPELVNRLKDLAKAQPDTAKYAELKQLAHVRVMTPEELAKYHVSVGDKQPVLDYMYADKVKKVFQSVGSMLADHGYPDLEVELDKFLKDHESSVQGDGAAGGD